MLSLSELSPPSNKLPFFSVNNRNGFISCKNYVPWDFVSGYKIQCLRLIDEDSGNYELLKLNLKINWGKSIQLSIVFYAIKKE